MSALQAAFLFRLLWWGARENVFIAAHTHPLNNSIQNLPGIGEQSTQTIAGANAFN